MMRKKGMEIISRTQVTSTFISGIVHGLPLGVAIGMGFVLWLLPNEQRPVPLLEAWCTFAVSMLPAAMFDAVVQFAGCDGSGPPQPTSPSNGSFKCIIRGRCDGGKARFDGWRLVLVLSRLLPLSWLPISEKSRRSSPDCQKHRNFLRA